MRTKAAICLALALGALALPVDETLSPERGIFPMGVDKALAMRQDEFARSTTQNGLSGPCKPVTVLFARGTTEIGNVGILTGPPFFQALAQRVGPGGFAVQGIDYPADILGFLAGGDAAGSALMQVLFL